MLVAIAIVLLMIAAYGAFWIMASRRYDRDVAAPRKKHTAETFARSLSGRGYSEMAVADAYGDLAELCGHPVLAEDRLYETLHRASEDIDFLVERRSRTAGIRDVWNSRYKIYLPLRTAEDYVYFLSELYRGTGKWDDA